MSTSIAILFLVIFGTWLYRESNPSSVASGARTASGSRVASGVRSTPTPKPSPPPPPAAIAMAFTQQQAGAPLHLIVNLDYASGDVHAVEIAWPAGTLGDWHYTVLTGDARLANFDDHHMVWGAAGSVIDLEVPPAKGKTAADLNFQAWDEANPSLKVTLPPGSGTHPSVFVGFMRLDGPAAAKPAATVTFHLTSTAPDIHLTWGGFGGADLKLAGVSGGANQPQDHAVVFGSAGVYDLKFTVQPGLGTIYVHAFPGGSSVCCDSNTRVLTVSK
ncbi:MAG: hypothetical protein ABI838_05290 [Chloroflexota bacterium]